MTRYLTLEQRIARKASAEARGQGKYRLITERPFANTKRWTMGGDELLEHFGITKGKKLPRTGLPARRIQGVLVWVQPWQPRMVKSRYDGVTREFKSSRHRVLAACPGCNQILSAGRLQQHICTTKHVPVVCSALGV